MKYIIDVPEEIAKISEEFLSKAGLLCEPYTEPDLHPLVDEAVETIENEVWELADYVVRMGVQERNLCFGFQFPTEVIADLTYQEAKSKFEAWLKQKDEIHYGDEIISVEDDVKAVMLDCADYESIYVMTEHGCVERWKDLDGVKKTGRHFPEVAELLEKMRGEERE